MHRRTPLPLNFKVFSVIQVATEWSDVLSNLPPRLEEGAALLVAVFLYSDSESKSLVPNTAGLDHHRSRLIRRLAWTR
jgi:hypothetical protein